MSDLLLNWFSIYGLPLMFGAVTFGQMGLPVPTSILLLTIGAMIANAAFQPWQAFASALAGAVLGDQIAFWIGRAGGEPLVARLRLSRYGAVIDRASNYTEEYGSYSVFLSRWLVSPIGPYLNYVVGMMGMSWRKFSIMSLAGEALWISLFMGLGFTFSRSIAALNDLLANASWFLGALIATLYLGRRVQIARLKKR